MNERGDLPLDPSEPQPLSELVTGASRSRGEAVPDAPVRDLIRSDCFGGRTGNWSTPR